MRRTCFFRRTDRSLRDAQYRFLICSVLYANLLRFRVVRMTRMIIVLLWSIYILLYKLFGFQWVDLDMLRLGIKVLLTCWWKVFQEVHLSLKRRRPIFIWLGQIPRPRTSATFPFEGATSQRSIMMMVPSIRSFILFLSVAYLQVTQVRATGKSPNWTGHQGLIHRSSRLHSGRCWISVQ
jgi:hypothetical protein